MINEHIDKYFHLKDSPDKLTLSVSALILLSLTSALLLVIGGDDPLGSNPPREFLYVFLSSCFGVAALILIASNTSLSRLKPVYIFGFALLLRLIALQAWPLLEDDYFRYLWDGRQTVLTFSPWQLAPVDFFSGERLSQEWQSILNGINNPELPSIYGPLLQYLFALAYIIDPGELWSVQLLLLIVDMAIFGMLIKQGAGARWLLVYSVHPLILKEAIASAHPDSLMALFILLALFFWQRKFAIYTGIFLGLAIATKVSALVALPLFFISPAAMQSCHLISSWIKRVVTTGKNSSIWSVKVFFGVLISVVVSYLPFSKGAGNELFSLTTFVQEWRFNPLLYQIFEYMPFVKEPRIVAAVMVFILVLLLIIYWIITNTKHTASFTPTPPVDLALFTLLIFSPVVNSWYWLWILPFALIKRRAWLVAGCCCGAFAYINSTVFYDTAWLTHFQSSHLFEVPQWVSLLQLGMLLALVVWFSSRLRFRPKVNV